VARLRDILGGSIIFIIITIIIIITVESGSTRWPVSVAMRLVSNIPCCNLYEPNFDVIWSSTM